jgi:hypothetical protein
MKLIAPFQVIKLKDDIFKRGGHIESGERGSSMHKLHEKLRDYLVAQEL